MVRRFGAGVASPPLGTGVLLRFRESLDSIRG
jgi:hypothetical protein